MRIGTQNFYDRSLFSMQTRQADLDRAQEELSTGKQILRPSDDPVASNSIIKLKKEIDVSERYIKTQDTAERFNVSGESNLQSMTNVLYRIEELLVQSVNGSLDSNSLQAIGEELQVKYDELLSLTNSRNANGDYFYSGYKTDQIPYVEDVFGYAQYQGDDGQREVLIAASYQVPVNDPGSSFIDNVSSKYGDFTAATPAVSGAQVSVGLITDPTEFSQPTAPASTFDLQFVGAPLTWQAVDTQSGTVVEGPHTYSAGDEITFQGISVKTDVNNPPVVGDQFVMAQDSTTSPEKNMMWVIGQAIEATQILGTVYTGSANAGSNIAVGGGELKNPENHNLADFQISFPAPGQIQVDEVDRSTIPLTVISNAVPAQAYNPAGTSLEFNGIEITVAGAEVVGETVRLDRPENTRRAEVIGTLQDELKNVFTNVDNIRSQIGARLNTISNEALAVEQFKDVLTKNLSVLEDVDIYEAMNNLQTSITGLQASQQSFAKIQNLSLFNYL